MRKAGKRLLVLAVTIGVLGALDQLALRTVLADGRFMGRPVAPFDPPIFSPAQRESLARIESYLTTGEPPAEAFRFDPGLGWCPPPGGGEGEFRYDWAGCRIAGAETARAKRPGLRRIVTIGCSMTHGEEVGAPETWCAVLDDALDDVEVCNLGVAAYGLDQALLRLRRDGLPLEPDEVWLGFLPGAALRVTTLYRPLLRHWSLDLAFKPRFVLATGGALELVPNPAHSLADISALVHSQELFLERLAGRDLWVDRAPLAYAPRGTSWLHRSFATRLGLTLHESGDRDLARWLTDPESEAFRLLAQIVRETAAEARSIEARFRLLILPGRDDLATGDFWSPWADSLAAEGLEVIDLAPALASAGDPGPLFAPNGHYSPLGGRVVGEALAERAR